MLRIYKHGGIEYLNNQAPPQFIAIPSTEAELNGLKDYAAGIGDTLTHFLDYWIDSLEKIAPDVSRQKLYEYIAELCQHKAKEVDAHEVEKKK